MEKQKEINQKNLRKFLLITLSHAENERRKGVTKEEAANRIKSIFECDAIIVVSEKHEKGGTHLHIGVKNRSASRYTASKIIQAAFPEFEGSQCYTKFHRGWGTICGYLTKQDHEPYTWGEFSRKDILKLGDANRKHTKMGNPPKKRELRLEFFLKKLGEHKQWLDVIKDKSLWDFTVQRYSNARRLWEDLRMNKEREGTLQENLAKYLEERGWPEEYSIEELQEKYRLLDWIATNVAWKRPIKTKQLFLYGKPSTQKTLFISILKKVLRIYSVGSRKNDFSGANDFQDLWVLDEFRMPGGDDPYAILHEEEKSYLNSLLTLLDGQECKLDAKYEKIFKKERNVPIIIIANRLPQLFIKRGPWHERVMPLRFYSNLDDIEEERVLATLWGCLKRREPKNGEDLMANQVLKYNNLRGYETQFVECTKEKEGWLTGYFQVKKKKGEPLRYKIKTEGGDLTPYIEVQYKELLKGGMGLINFAVIPLKKETMEVELQEGHEEYIKTIITEEGFQGGEKLRVFRSPRDDRPDFAACPLYPFGEFGEKRLSSELYVKPTFEEGEALDINQKKKPSNSGLGDGYVEITISVGSIADYNSKGYL